MQTVLRIAGAVTLLAMAGCGRPAITPQPSPVMGGATPSTSVGGSATAVGRDSSSATYPAPLPQGNIGTTRVQ